MTYRKVMKTCIPDLLNFLDPHLFPLSETLIVIFVMKTFLEQILEYGNCLSLITVVEGLCNNNLPKHDEVLQQVLFCRTSIDMQAEKGNRAMRRNGASASSREDLSDNLKSL